MTRGYSNLSFPRMISLPLGTPASEVICNVLTNEKWELVDAIYSHSTKGTDAGAVNLQIEKLTGTQAPGAGTALLTNNTNAGFDCKGANNTPQTAALTTTKADLQFTCGDRIGVVVSGTTTALAGACLTLFLKPITR